MSYTKESTFKIDDYRRYRIIHQHGDIIAMHYFDTSIRKVMSYHFFRSGKLYIKKYTYKGGYHRYGLKPAWIEYNTNGDVTEERYYIMGCLRDINIIRRLKVIKKRKEILKKLKSDAI